MFGHFFVVDNNYEDWHADMLVASNESTDALVLDKLAKSKYWQVRLAVAKNLNTPYITLGYLLSDSRIEVRNQVIERVERGL